MTAHKHAEIIKAKSDNMELVVFRKNHDNSWGKIQCHDCCFMPDFEYFLCLPQHKEACLHWLNGGQIECKIMNSENWFSIDCAEKWKWSSSNNTMNEKYEVRIKPRKEKRWIAINVKDGDVCICTENSTPAPGYQIKEIEVEV